MTINVESWDLTRPTKDIGQPFRVRTLEKFIDYAKSIDGVFFPSREEIARWCLAGLHDKAPTGDRDTGRVGEGENGGA